MFVLHWNILRCVLLCGASLVLAENSKRPNVVFIIADDLGWDDVSFHGSSQIITPNIDLLAYSGVAFKRYYTHSICTPSRSATLSGKFAHRMGMQGYPLTNGEDRGLPLNVKLLPQYLKDLGYSTHLVGKWHLGLSRNQFLPTFRGFDSHFGHRGGYIDYYEYNLEETWMNYNSVSGYDMHKNLTTAWDVSGYITDVYSQEAISRIKSHNPKSPLFLMVAHNAPHSGNNYTLMQAPASVVRQMRHVEPPFRRVLAAMMKKLDDSVGDIVHALYEKNILNNTIIVFVSDNGAMTTGDSQNYGSNWPLRGLKTTPFEGGIRVPALLWTSNVTNHLWKGYMHSSDWLPTLLSGVGAKVPTGIDGKDLWNEIISNMESKRDELYEINDYSGFASIISGQYKYIIGKVDKSASAHTGEDMRGIIGTPPSYLETLQNSQMYTVLNKIGKQFNVGNLDLRNQIQVNCNVEGEKKHTICQPTKEVGCLFNIKEDPCEYNDLSGSHLEIAHELLGRLQKELKRVVPRQVPLYRDPKALPWKHNHTWTTFMEKGYNSEAMPSATLG